MNIRYDIQNINVVVSADTKRWDRIFILVNFNFLQHHSHIRCVEISPQLILKPITTGVILICVPLLP